MGLASLWGTNRTLVSGRGTGPTGGGGRGRQCKDADNDLEDDVNCQRHLNKCLETQLSDLSTSGTFGRSACYDCFRLCNAQGYWPFSHPGVDCDYTKFR